MRPRQAIGRPGTPVIPANWAASHQPVAEKAQTAAACELREPGTVQTWNPVTDQMDTAPHAAYYTGGCAVVPLTNDARIAVQAEDPETVTGYLVTVPAVVGLVLDGHLVKITSSDDTALTGRVLTVKDVVRGSHRFERDLICTLTD